MIVDVKEIHIDPKERLRQDLGDIKRMVISFHKYGQLQSILVRPPRANESVNGKRWVVVEGGRRMLAVELARKSDISIRNLEPGAIKVEIEEECDDELFSLEQEFFANEDRKNFDWKEKANFIRRIHEGHCALDEEWDVIHTAALLEMGDKTVYKYLEFFKHPEAFAEESVQSALTFNVAHKQFQIARDAKKRERQVEFREKKIKERTQEAKAEAEKESDSPDAVPVSVYVPPSEFAQMICQLGDCREFVKQIPDDTFDWVHWDPPYGGEQGGGAFGSFESIDDSWVYARSLMDDMFSELWRTLRDGSWLVLWFHPQYYNDIVTMLQGHELDYEEGRCLHCDTEWESHKLNLRVCIEGRPRFWVNPYPNIWYKVNRQSAGQEIRRFLVNAYETFLFASPVKEPGLRPNPILPKTDRQNVFVANMPTRDERRHSMHKPVDLLEKVLECVSIPGELGFDPSVGGGSLIEAALKSMRKVVAIEIDRQIRNRAVEAVEECVKETGREPYSLDFSL